VGLPADSRGACGVDRIETADGTGVALGSYPGAPTMVRCHSGSVYARPLDGRADSDVLKPFPGQDPFLAREVLHGDGYTRWLMGERSPGQPGSLRFEWRGGRVQLRNGHFITDRFTSIALLKDGWVDTATEAGWIRSPRADWAISAAIPPAG